MASLNAYVGRLARQFDSCAAAGFVGRDGGSGVGGGVVGFDGGSEVDPSGLWFEVGSVGKTFTGTLLSHMVSSRDVSLDERVGDLLPDLASSAVGDAPLLSLATHTAGLPTWPPDLGTPRYLRLQEYTFDRLLLSAKGITTVRQARHRYSTFGMTLLGHALAARAGQSYESLVRDRLFEPLGISALTADDRSGTWLAGRLNDEEAPAFDFPVFMPAGASWRMTIADLRRWVGAHLDPPDAFRDAATLALRPHYKGRARVVGLGWGMNAFRSAWVHFGGTVGFRCFVAVDPKRHVALTVALNHNQRRRRHIVVPRLRAFDRACASALNALR